MNGISFRVIVARSMALLFWCVGFSAYAHPGFTENRGQITDSNGKPRPDILCVSSDGKAQLYFMSDRIVKVHLPDLAPTSLLKAASPLKTEILFTTLPAFKAAHSFKSIQSQPRIRYEDQLSYKSNYYLAHCPDGITGVRTFKRIVYENVTANADLVFEMSARGEVHSFVHDKADKRKTPVTLASPDSEEPNYISDPKVLYATYLGGIRNESGSYGAADSKSNFWLTGTTGSYNFPITDSALERSITATAVIYISKFSPTGELLYSTFYGGNAGGGATSIAVDAEDNPVITGYTLSTGFPVSDAAFQKTNNGYQDILIVKLDQTGKRLWATLMGGSGSDYGNYIAIDKDNNVIVTGETTTYNETFPTTAGSFQPAYGGGASDAFIAKFDKSGNRMWATYFGGKDNYFMQRPFGGDKGSWIAVDSQNNIIITGTTRTAVNFPVTADAFQKDSSFMDDAFLAKFSPDGQRIWATLYGGTGTVSGSSPSITEDQGKSVAVDNNDNIIMVGHTKAVDFPVSPDALVGKPINLSGGGYIVKFSRSGTRLWATYYGNHNNAVKADKSGNIYVFGSAINEYNSFKQTSDSIKAMPGSNPGGMALSILREQKVQFASTYPRFSGINDPFDMAVAPNGTVALFGHTDDGRFPVTQNALLQFTGNNPSGYDKAFFIILQNLATGIEDNTPSHYQSIEVTPNPAQDYILISLPDQAQQVELSISNILGESFHPISALDSNRQSFRISISSLPAGIYFLRADTQHKVFTSVFVKY